jgi:multiple sugar transport system permease protein
MLDVGWAISMKYAEGYTRLGWTLVSLVLLAAFVFLLGRALQVLGVGVAYTVWTGIGAVGTLTMGVLLFTILFGLLAGYALAVMRFRGRQTVLSGVILVLVVPFQLLQIPLYVLIVRGYGLGDTYIGMILPFAINSTAVFIFRQFFLQLPKELFESARIDGAGELGTMLRIAIPLARPAILNAVLLTFIGPWNEFLWPFLVTKQQDMQPFAVALANYMNNVAGRATNPDGANMAGGVLLAIPPVVLFLIFQKHFTSANIGSGVKG